MKKILRIASVVLLNVSLILIGLVINWKYTENILDKTLISHDAFQGFIWILGLLFGLTFYSFTNNKIIRRFGIGGLLFVIPSIIFMVFYLNKSITTEGNYKTFKIRDATIYGQTAVLNIGFKSQYNFTIVPLDKCFKVDSVHVRVDNGLFGMEVISNDLKIIESYNCTQSAIDSTNILKSHFNIGHELAKKRCFTNAIDHYSSCISLDTNNSDYYYHRGRMFMVLAEYEKAFADFYLAALLKYKSLDNETIDSLHSTDFNTHVQELFDKIEKKDFSNISNNMKFISVIDEFDTYQMNLEFCIEKLKE